MADPTLTTLAGAASTTATTTVNFTAATGGELLLLGVNASDARATTGTGRPESTGWTYVNGGIDFTGNYLWYKIAAPGESSVQYKIGSANPSTYVCVKADNIDGTTPFGTSTVLHTHGGSTTGTTAFTPTAGTRWVMVSFFGASRAGASSMTPYSTLTNSFTIQTSATTTTPDTYIASMGYRILDGGVSTNTVTSAWNTDSPSCSFGILASFKVVPSGAETGTLSASLPKMTGSISGTASGPVYTGAVAASLPIATSSLSGTVAGPSYTGTVSATLSVTTATISGTVVGPAFIGSLAATFPKATGAMTGTVTAPTYTGTVAASLPIATASISGTTTAPTYTGTVTATFPPMQSTITGTVTAPAGSGTVSATLPLMTASLPGIVVAPIWTGAVSSQLPPMAASLSGTVTLPAGAGTLAGVFPRMSSNISGTITLPPVAGTISASLPRMTAVVSGGDPSYTASTGLSAAPADPTYAVVGVVPPTIYVGGPS